MKKTALILTVLSALILSACSFDSKEDTANNPENQNSETEITTEDSQPTDEQETTNTQTLEEANSNYESALNSGKTSACENIVNEALKNDCIRDAAIQNALESNDKSECDVIADNEEAESCRNLVDKNA